MDQNTPPRSAIVFATLTIAWLVVFFFLASAVPALDSDFSDGISVDSTVDEADANLGDNVCADSMARCTLRAAVQEANATVGDHMILLTAGTFTLTVAGSGEDSAVSGDLDVTETLLIVGAGPTLTLIDANGAVVGDRAVHVYDPAATGLAVTLEDLTITGGSVLNTNGGGVLVEAAEGGGPPVTDPLEGSEASIVLTLRRVKISNNTADSNMTDPDTGQPIGGSGGGVYSEAELIVENSELSGNTAAANGGGFYTGGAVTLSGSLVGTNQAEGGGGIFETGNHISSYTDCAIVGNNAVGGGGLTSRTQTTLQFLNCTIDDNSATDVGGGIQTNGTVNLVFSTVTANSSDTEAPNGGAGLNVFGGGSFRLWSTLVADNVVAAVATPEERNCGCTGSGCTAMVQFVSLGHNLEDIDTCFFDDPADQPSTEPGIGPLDSTIALRPVRPLLSGSAAIDAGEDAVCPGTDQRGVNRPVDGDGDNVLHCDTGAYEFLRSIFSNGFESGDTSAWSTIVGGA